VALYTVSLVWQDISFAWAAVSALPVDADRCLEGTPKINPVTGGTCANVQNTDQRSRVRMSRENSEPTSAPQHFGRCTVERHKILSAKSDNPKKNNEFRCGQGDFTK
jgi:hypothetical protein